MNTANVARTGTGGPRRSIRYQSDTVQYGQLPFRVLTEFLGSRSPTWDNITKHLLQYPRAGTLVIGITSFFPMMRR